MKKLQRTLSLPGAIAVSIGGMLSGIFVLPGLAVGITGSSVWLAFLVAALCILPAVLSKVGIGNINAKIWRHLCLYRACLWAFVWNYFWFGLVAFFVA